MISAFYFLHFSPFPLCVVAACEAARADHVYVFGLPVELVNRLFGLNTFSLKSLGIPSHSSRCLGFCSCSSCAALECQPLDLHIFETPAHGPPLLFQSQSRLCQFLSKHAAKRTYAGTTSATGSLQPTHNRSRRRCRPHSALSRVQDRDRVARKAPLNSTCGSANNLYRTSCTRFAENINQRGMEVLTQAQLSVR